MENTPPLLAADWSWSPPESIPFFAVALALSLLLGMSEVAGAYRGKPHAVHAVFNRWAMPYYLLYLLLTYLLGRILLEQQLITPNWTSAVVIGLLAPTLLKTQVKLFKPLAGSEGLNDNLEKILNGVQEFCFSQINIHLSQRRINAKIALANLGEKRLLEIVTALYGDQQFQQSIQPLLEERRELNPSSVALFLVELIERESPELLEQTKE